LKNEKIAPRLAAGCGASTLPPERLNTMTKTTSTTETEVTMMDDLYEIGAARRYEIHLADAKYDPLIEETGEALQEAYYELAFHVAHIVPDIELKLKDAESRRLLDIVEERLRANADADIASQFEHQKIEDKFNKLTVEYFAKYPHPIITTVDQRVEASRANETLKGQTNANR
jgi:hypothetical protein